MQRSAPTPLLLGESGGGCATLVYWWQIAWTDLPTEVQVLIKNGTLSINVLELFGQVLGFFGAVLALFLRKEKFAWQPRLKLQGDNSTAEAWMKKFSNPSLVARLLTRLLGHAIKTSGVSADPGHVEGELNYFCDAVSRGHPSKLIPEKMGKLTVADVRECLQVSEEWTSVPLHRFRPGPDLLSAVVSALLQREPCWERLQNVSSWGQMIPGEHITFTLRPKSWSWTMHS
jgi:hypothetical protein